MKRYFVTFEFHEAGTVHRYLFENDDGDYALADEAQAEIDAMRQERDEARRVAVEVTKEALLDEGNYEDFDNPAFIEKHATEAMKKAFTWKEKP